MKKLFGSLTGVSLIFCISLNSAVAQIPKQALSPISTIHEQQSVCLWVGGASSNRVVAAVEQNEKDLVRETRIIAQDILKTFTVKNRAVQSLSRCENGIKIKVYSLPIETLYKVEEGKFKGFQRWRISGAKVWGTLSVMKFGEPLFEKDWDGEVNTPDNLKGRQQYHDMNFAPYIEALKNSNLAVSIQEGAELLSLEQSRK
ncbi:MAG: hypothetical protein O7D34_02940 [Ignavibacteria bacterium]|nr:hypothetical protein [Ignavibacteria bacterium]